MPSKASFLCQACGASFPKWQGRCATCGAWNSLQEQVSASRGSKVQAKTVVKLNAVDPKSNARLSVGLAEFDRVLGGGLLPDSFVLLGGAPGIGKSTLALQIAAHLSQRTKVLYLSGEESAAQVALRASRLALNTTQLDFLQEHELETILASALTQQSKILILDSIQTIGSNEAAGEAGSQVQVRTCAEKLMEFAKQNSISVILIGHITKDGTLAGPKTMEHLVDTVLYLEGDKKSDYRLLRASKNRFGSTNELGVFEMKEQGLQEVSEPAKVFLKDQDKPVPGTCVTASLQGERVFFVQVQALTATTNFGYPKRLASGYSLNHLQLIIAILSRQVGLKLDNKDVYLKVSGGFQLNDPGADLAVALAIASSVYNQALPANTLALGELSLSGEINKVPRLQERQKEAERLGYQLLSVNAKNQVPQSIQEACQLFFRHQS